MFIPTTLHYWLIKTKQKADRLDMKNHALFVIDEKGMVSKSPEQRKETLPREAKYMPVETGSQSLKNEILSIQTKQPAHRSDKDSLVTSSVRDDNVMERRSFLDIYTCGVLESVTEPFKREGAYYRYRSLKAI